MRIMYLLFSFTVGGTERLVANICNEMKKRGNDVYLYIVNDSVDDTLIHSLDEEVTAYLQRRKIGSGKLLSSSIKIAKYVCTNNIEVIHCNSFDSPELVFISKLLNPNLKVFYTIHGMNQYKKLSKTRKTYRNIICNRIIGISECVKQDLVHNGAAESKTVMIYNGICELCSNDVYLKKGDSEIIIGCVARFMPNVKGQDILVEATKILYETLDKNFKVVFAGDVIESQKETFEQIEKYINENNLNDIISFVGNIDNVPAFMNSIDICVVPSRTEGFGLTLIEAMSMGVPCIVSNVEGLVELVDLIGIGDLFDAGNVESLAKTIVDVVDNIDDKKKSSMIAKEAIREQFSIEKMCASLERIYTE